MARVMSPGVRAAVVESSRIICQVDVNDVRNGTRLLSTHPENPGESRMKVIGGSISTDEMSSIVGTGTARLLVDAETAEAVLPLVQSSGLSPTAPAQVHVRFYSEFDEVRSDYGSYEVDNVTVDDTSDGVVMTVEVSDNSRRVARAQFWRPVTIANKTPYATFFHTLLDDILPYSEIQVGPTLARTGLKSFDVQDDRLVAVNEAATAIGYRIDWNADGRGNVDILDDTSLVDEPVWDFTVGGNAKMIGLRRGLTDEKSYNGVIAMGEDSGSDKPPVRAEFWDNDPNSPTYFNPSDPDSSAYGPVPFFYVSQFITNGWQAYAAAAARLPKVLGVVEVLTLECVPNPGIVPGDPILVDRPQTGVEGVFIVSSTDLPLTGSDGRMTIVCRERRVFA